MRKSRASCSFGVIRRPSGAALSLDRTAVFHTEITGETRDTGSRPLAWAATPEAGAAYREDTSQ
ncbi:MAG TPA: hypothetical protein DHU96_07220 [Actinobacteria bacterium]|nr:hypothetical protein [Actinomycetota bacterium]